MALLAGSKMFGNLNELISPEYKNFYDRLISDLQVGKTNKNYNFHPHFVLKFKNKNFSLYKKIVKEFGTANRKELIVFHKKLISERGIERKNLICFSDERLINELKVLQNLNFSSFLKTMAPVTSSDIVQNPKKIAKLFTLDGHKWFVAIQITKPVEYISNKVSLDRAFSKHKNLFTVQKWAVVNELGKSFFISQFLGYTLEQKIKYKSLDKIQIKNVLDTILTAKRALELSNLFWREFAPRNMFIGNVGNIVFIDFENIYVKSQLGKIELNYLEEITSVWFADIFDSKAIKQITGGRTNLSQSLSVSADGVEKCVFNRKKISYLRRKNLFDITRKFEKKYTKNGYIVYGHRMGRFITDFLKVEAEVKLLKLINKLKSTDLFIYLSTLQFLVNVDMETTLRDFYFMEKKKTHRLYSVDFIEKYSYRWIKKHKSDSLGFIYKPEESYKSILTKANYLLQ